jgi:hypothetical protein
MKLTKHMRRGWEAMPFELKALCVGALSVAFVFAALAIKDLMG